MKEVIIIGAGLSGLTAAYYLKQKKVDVLVIEARERTGGRILTVPAGGNRTPVEMGATWFADKHVYLVHLLQELKLPIFKQYQQGIGVVETHPTEEPQLFKMPDDAEPSYRVAGGTSRLIEALVHYIGQEQILLNTAIISVLEHPDHLEIKTHQEESLSCRKLIITIPPSLIQAQNIAFTPELPPELVRVMENTHTWMADSIKFAVEYQKPFWQEQGYSGTAFSHTGIIPEMYDHSNAEGTQFALKGFLTAAAAELSQNQRKALVVAQLSRLLGEEAAHYLSYTEKLWQQEVYTFAHYSRFVMPHQHNGHPVYAQPLLNGKLILAGTETSPYFGGYMDGAVYSGLAAAKNILLQPKES